MITLVFCPWGGWWVDRCPSAGCGAGHSVVRIPDGDAAIRLRVLIEATQLAHEAIADGDTGEALERLRRAYREVTGLPIESDPA